MTSFGKAFAGALVALLALTQAPNADAVVYSCAMITPLNATSFSVVPCPGACTGTLNLTGCAQLVAFGGLF